MAFFAPLRPADPRSLGGLRLLGRLGEGGQGVVYLGENADGGKAAVKWLRPDLSGDEVSVGRFLREVEVARHVAPFCTAAVLGTGIEQDRPYIVSEFIEGPSLQRVVQEQGPRTGTVLHRLAIGTATALAAIHQAGIVHRDFKPANVIIGADGPRVIDFGIARALNATSTISNSVVGTPSYMPPEQIMGHTVGPAADMFSWAGTMIYAASGRAPFGSDTMPAVINRVLSQQPDLGVLDGTLREVVAACLAKDPAQRPTAEQVMMRLLQHSAPGSGMLAQGAAEAAVPPPPAAFPGPPSHAGPPSHVGPPSHAGPPSAGPHSQGPVPAHAYAPPTYAPHTHPAAQPRSGRRAPLVAGVAVAIALLVLAGVFVAIQADKASVASPSTTPREEGRKTTTPPAERGRPRQETTSAGRTDVPARGTKRTLPGGAISLYENPSDAIVLTSYEIYDEKKETWTDYARDSLRGPFTKYAGNMESLVSPDGRYLASRGKRYAPDDHDFIVIADRETGERTTIKTVKKPQTGIIRNWSKDGETILLSIGHKRGDTWTYPGFMLVDVVTKRVKQVDVSDPDVRGSSWGFDGDETGTVNVYGDEDDLSLRFFDAQGKAVRSQANIGTLAADTTQDLFSPSGDAFVTNCPDGTYNDHCVWDAGTGERLRTFYSDCDEVLGFYDEEHLFCWENDNGANDEVQVVDFKGKLVRKLMEVPDSLDLDPVFTRNPAHGS
ncbi:protein kinase [Nonomuraea sp. NPDC049419]|uniref:protein kinase domain-containing protein n=1 Tax=Nonomuraea sp. NPDC049419 TaxID=3155772 RepID=UPI003420FBBD